MEEIFGELLVGGTSMLDPSAPLGSFNAGRTHFEKYFLILTWFLHQLFD